MARESQLWSWLSKARLSYKMALHMHRIENPVSPGMPDVEGFLEGSTCGQFWIELKSAARPVKASTPIRFKMRPKQVEWARRRWKLGGACYWLLQVGDGGARRIYMLDGGAGGMIAKGMSEDMLRARDVLCFYFEPKSSPEMVIKAAASRA